VEEAAATFSRIGVVTYYGTAPGMCASPTLPFGTVVTITNPQNGDTTHCTVDDREADSARQIDLSTETFATIAPLSQGVITDAELSW
jgi:rare lipoprotein A (peptidoglycan hydrolase)